MRVVRSLGDLNAPAERASVAIGSFDGIHTGHRVIMERVVRHARVSSGTPVIFTFHPHPRALLHPDQPPRILTTLDEQIRILDSIGVEMVVVLPFDRSFAAMTADDFVRTWLVSRFRLGKLVVGYDFRLGRGREGNGAVLSDLAGRYRFEVEIVGPERDGERPIKSTWIRDEIEEGRVHVAARLLRRYHSMAGIVSRGDGRGRTIGFPTANLETSEPEKLMPARGVYAAYAEIAGRIHRAVANVGIRPTFGEGGDLRAEAHLLDFEGEIVGEQFALHFVRSIREEKTFSSPEELAAMISGDCEEAAGILIKEDEKKVFTRF